MTTMAILLFSCFSGGDLSPADELPSKPDLPTRFNVLEHGWILWHLYAGDVETLYKSDDLAGVFLYIVALHKAIGERAPDLYDENAQLQLALAFTKFGVSGHNIESVLEAFLYKPDDFFNGAIKMAITPKAAEMEAQQFIQDFGAESSVMKGIEAGITKFAGGARDALEKKYRPANDGVRPPNVSEEEFAKDPTIGKKQIMRFGEMYAYYDAEIIRKHSGGSASRVKFFARPIDGNID
jgi:hypothetical protein